MSLKNGSNLFNYAEKAFGAVVDVLHETDTDIFYLVRSNNHYVIWRDRDCNGLSDWQIISPDFALQVAIPFTSHFIKDYSTVWTNGQNQLIHLIQGFDLFRAAFITVLNANGSIANRVMLGTCSNYNKETGNPII